MKLYKVVYRDYVGLPSISSSPSIERYVLAKNKVQAVADTAPKYKDGSEKSFVKIDIVELCNKRDIINI